MTHNFCKLGVFFIKTSGKRLPPPIYSLFQRPYCIRKEISSIECWKCGTKKSSLIDLFCSQCKTIQNPHNYKNCFSVMGFPTDYNVDGKLLIEKYRKMQNLLHPDKYTNKSDEEQKISEDYSSLVNHAFNTLKSPMSRALHMLALRGEEVTDADTIDDKKFLLEIMDLSEDVEEAQTFPQLKALEDKNNEILERFAQDIGKKLLDGDVKSAKELTLRMQYYHNVGKQITEYMREMGYIE